MAEKIQSKSPYFKTPVRSSSSSLVSVANSSFYDKTTFYQQANPSTSLESDRPLAGNIDFGSSSSSASFDSSSFFDFKPKKGRKTTSYDTTPSRSTPNRSRNLMNNATLNETSFFGEVNVGCVVAIVEGRGSARGEVGLASISLFNPTLILCQISDTRTYARVLTKLAVLNPSEIIVPNGATVFNNHPAQNKLYEDIAEKFKNAKITEVHRKYFSESKGLQMVKHLCAAEFNSVELQIRHKYYALSAVSCLLKYVEFVENILYAPKSLKIVFQSSNDSMIIDVDTAKHVELLSSSLNKSSKNSLFGLLNKCSTKGGIRLLRSTLFQPPIKEELINERLDAVAELIERPEILTSIQATLNRMCDLDNLLSLCVILPKAETLHLVEQRINQIIGLKHALDLIPQLITTLSADIQSPLLVKILEVLKSHTYPMMLDQVKCVIQDEARVVKGAAAMRLQRCFAIKEGVRELLDIARQTYCELVKDIESQVSIFAESQGLPMRVGFNAARGYHIQMNRSALIAIKGKRFKLSELPCDFINPHQYKNVISFTTENIVKIDQQSQNALREITLMSNVIIQELICTLRESIGSLYKLSESVSLLDMIAAFADVSGTNNYARPRFGSLMVVKDSKHPILDRMNSAVVSNDIIATPLEANFQVISGPNMSGKSTFLKQILLLQIMAQSGCFVPAENEPMPMFRLADSIFSRVGMSDSIECNASTFAMEMKEMAYIMNNLGSASLVIMDELGRGTSPEEGSALCWAISEALAQTSAFTFLATHFRLLSKMESICIGIVNSTFVTELTEGDEGDTGSGLVHTHKIVRGQLEMSEIAHYGLHLAKKVNFPQRVLDKAESFVEQITAQQVDLPEVKEEDVARLNYLRLAMTLQKLHLKEDLSIEEKLEIAQNIQQQFLCEDSDDENEM